MFNVKPPHSTLQLLLQPMQQRKEKSLAHNYLKIIYQSKKEICLIYYLLFQ